MIKFMSQLGSLPKSQLLADLLGLISSVLENTMKKTLLERFNEKHTIIMPSNCWMWVADADTCGYGRMRIKGKHVGAHRISYELHNGAIPEGLHVLHQCDTPVCVNPAHLSLGTHADNMRDRDLKGRNNPFMGEKHYAAKLTEKDVLEMRALRLKGALLRELAAKFDVGLTAVGRIVKRNTWKHI